MAVAGVSYRTSVGDAALQLESGSEVVGSGGKGDGIPARGPGDDPLDHGARLPSIDVVRCCTRHRADSQQEQRQSFGHESITWLVVTGGIGGLCLRGLRSLNRALCHGQLVFLKTRLR